uniref:Uncharacterized protein n=1 Tax=Anguilla anguilla TaxID=7936 RepID=A0A0E9U5M3_ANGAN
MGHQSLSYLAVMSGFETAVKYNITSQ